MGGRKYPHCGRIRLSASRGGGGTIPDRNARNRVNCPLTSSVVVPIVVVRRAPTTLVPLSYSAARIHGR